MATLEMVEKLRQRANVSYDEARAALEACGDDLLEAMIYLERQGKVNPPAGGGYYSTAHYAHDGAEKDSCAHQRTGESFGQLMRRFGGWLRRVIHKGNTNHFEVWHREERSVSVPVTILILLLLFCFCVTIPLLVIGLFFGCSYRFRGPELENSAVNDVMNSASRAADNLKNEVLHPEDHQQNK